MERITSKRSDMSGSVRNLIKELFIGFCLGAANIIPGVSGGTFLLIFNIYERVFAILNGIDRSVVTRIISLGWTILRHQGRQRTITDFSDFCREKDFIFLIKLLTGAVAAILALSTLMKYLLIHHFSVTYSLFFGLILVSVLIPVKMLKRLRARLILFVCLGGALTVTVSWAVNPYDKAKIKSDHYRAQYRQMDPAVRANGAGDAGPLSYTGKYTPDEYLYAAICGAVSISAMVLPGISGSLVMILMGAYFDVISAISALKQFHMDTILFLGSFACGIVVGGLLFARIIHFVLNRWYDATMAFLIGLMAGSLYALWPFKKLIVMQEQFLKQDGVITLVENARIYTNVNVLPPLDAGLAWAIVSFGIGCVIMVAFMKADLSVSR